jgi:HTH-type transcriptional regulator/antitoxin MqsA
MEGNVCPICASGNLHKVVSTEDFQYKDKTVYIENYVSYECDLCEESIVDKETFKRSGKILKDFQRKTDGFLTSEEIKRIRKKLNLTQEEMGTTLGGGLKAFTRYENGQITQSKIMDNLLKVLDKYPTAINVLIQEYQYSTNVVSFFDYRKPFNYHLSGDITPADTDVNIKIEAIG